MYMYKYMHAYTYMYTYNICIYTHTHTHTHRHTWVTHYPAPAMILSSSVRSSRFCCLYGARRSLPLSFSIMLTCRRLSSSVSLRCACASKET